VPKRIIEILIILIVLVWEVHRSPDVGYLQNSGYGSIFLRFARPLAFLFLVIFSVRPDEVRIRPKGLIGLFLSYISIFIFEFKTTPTSRIGQALQPYISIFYGGILTVGAFTLGRSFAIIPSLKNLKTNGLFSTLRHPIYSSYIHLGVCHSFLFPSFRNFVATSLLLMGLVLRSHEEEGLLSTKRGYLEYLSLNKPRFFTWAISAPAVIFLLVVLFSPKEEPPLRVSLASPVIEMNSSIYDDWSSIFVANHALIPLLPASHESKSPTITRSIAMECVSKGNAPGGHCPRVRLSFVFAPITGCDQGKIDFDTFTRELSAIMKARNWIFEDPVDCSDRSRSLFCMEVGYDKDLHRKLLNLYLRFGWSQFALQKPDRAFGFGSHCLEKPARDSQGVIRSGFLRSRTPDFRDVEFDDFVGKGLPYDISLYGDGPVRNAQAEQPDPIDLRNPLGYYLVLGPSFDPNPALARVMQITIEHLIRNGIIHEREASENFSAFLPSGNIPFTRSFPRSCGKISPLLLPDFLPSCNALAESLNREKDRSCLKAGCVNISTFIAQHVTRRSSDWGAFVSPLTPGSPSLGSMEDQYFRSKSRESWVWTEPSGSRYQLLGVGRSLVGRGSDRVCAIVTTPLGLGDIHAKDIVLCD
jgi:protein-S-isoprenylcysteine O-methyltransferase Ste14